MWAKVLNLNKLNSNQNSGKLKLNCLKPLLNLTVVIKLKNVEPQKNHQFHFDISRFIDTFVV